MAYLSSFKVGDTTYQLKDAELRSIVEQMGSPLTAQYVTALPAVSSAKENVIYIVPVNGESAALEGPDVCEEFILVEGAFEKIGDTTIDLSAYAKVEDLGALAYKDSATGTISGVVTGINGVEYTPEGSVGVQVTNTATTATASGSFNNGTGDVSIDYTPAGSVSAPTVTVTPNTAAVANLTSVGTLPSKEPDKFTAATLLTGKSSFTTEGVVTSVEGETLVFTAASAADAITTTTFNGGSFTEGAFNAGTLPTKGTDVTVVTGIKSATASAPTFTGTQATLEDTVAVSGDVSVTVTYDKATSASGSFSGTKATITPTVTTGNKTVTVS